MLGQKGYAFDSDKYYLGRLCLQHHNWLGSGKSLRRNKTGACRDCLDEIKYWDKFSDWVNGNFEGVRHAPLVRKRMLQARISQFDSCCAFCQKQGHHAIDFLKFPEQDSADIFNNLLPICYECSKSKRETKVEDWYKQQSFYSSVRLEYVYWILNTLKDEHFVECS